MTGWILIELADGASLTDVEERLRALPQAGGTILRHGNGEPVIEGGLYVVPCAGGEHFAAEAAQLDGVASATVRTAPGMPQRR